MRMRTLSTLLLALSIPVAGCGGSGSGQRGSASGAGGSPSSGDRAESAARTVTVPAGTTLDLTLDQQLDTKQTEKGDGFSATVASPVAVGGRVAIPAGAEVYGVVTAVQKSGGAGQAAVLKVDFQRLQSSGRTYPIQATLTKANPRKESRTSAGQAAAEVGAGTAAGAILGRIIGGNKTGTFIGAAVGAATGTAIVLGTQDVDAVLPEGSHVEIRLDSPAQVAAGS
ncbi:MAG: hypothetical protein Q8W51_07870 [Candidatus Palauibacterales bacterium]|nr:hypothetical protein [Candidatus Palauibacterales bacterium]MDP2529640.1 hypothetical protein [Candidatus Palauibacterales bacterium]